MSEPSMEPITPILMNEMATIRALASLLKIDMTLLEELAELREFRASHSLPIQSGGKARTKSEAVRHMEAIAVFGEYLDREIARLGRKADAMQAGTFSAIKEADRGERERNEAIAHRALAAATARRASDR